LIRDGEGATTFATTERHAPTEEGVMKTFYRKLIDLRQRYAKEVAIALGLLAILAFLLAQVIPDIEQWMLKSNALTLLIFLLVLDISYVLSQLVLRPQITVSRDQDDDQTEFLKLCKNSRIDRADLLEFSTAEAGAIIRALKERQCPMRILVKHPDSVQEDDAKERVIQTVWRLIEHTLDDCPKASIRCYRQPASIRGRRLGNAYLNLSWYTPDLKTPQFETRGHTNPLITVDLATLEGQYLLRMFEGLFDRLWTSKYTEDAKAVMDHMKQSKPAVTA
jgi:hypothetical protein